MIRIIKQGNLVFTPRNFVILEGWEFDIGELQECDETAKMCLALAVSSYREQFMSLKEVCEEGQSIANAQHEVQSLRPQDIN